MQTTITTTNVDPAAVAVAGGVIGVFLTGALIFYILLVIAGWKIFEKAGEPGWKALIPIYNMYIMFKIVDMTGWFWGTLLVSLCASLIASFSMDTSIYVMDDAQIAAVNWGDYPAVIIALLVQCVVTIWAEILYAIRMAKVFGKGVGYTLGLIFLPNIFWLILGFGKAKYNKKHLKK